MTFFHFRLGTLEIMISRAALGRKLIVTYKLSQSTRDFCEVILCILYQCSCFLFENRTFQFFFIVFYFFVFFWCFFGVFDDVGGPTSTTHTRLFIVLNRFNTPPTHFFVFDLFYGIICWYRMFHHQKKKETRDVFNLFQCVSQLIKGLCL